MKLCNIGNGFDYEMEKLIRLYLPFEKIEVLHTKSDGERLAVVSLEETNAGLSLYTKLCLSGKKAERKKEIEKRFPEKETELMLAGMLADCFFDITDYAPQWGILTGVRPARLLRNKIKELGEEKAREYFKNVLRVSDSKLDLCLAAAAEDKIISLSGPMSYSLYFSVPFCPSRCSYCSFVSHSVDKAGELIPAYVEKLCEELKYTAQIAQSLGLKLETVYMGGGTPTTLNENQLYTVLDTVARHFDLSNVREFTVEAGRPDTVSPGKLDVIKQCGAGRISINPQTLDDGVLKAIGRRHTEADFYKAFKLAEKAGFNAVNTDLIAGLPTDTVEGFKNTVDKIIKLSPQSVTVHSLSMKRASTLTERGEFPEIDAGRNACEMVDYARHQLTLNGILPYYMYRQSKTVGNLENVGYAKEGFEGLYNVYIMDETHTVLACGASAVTKLREPNGNKIKRIFNFKYPYEYIGRFEEQLKRKSDIELFYKDL